MTLYGSDAIVDLLVDLGVDLIPLAPGATFRGLHDSLVHHRGDGPEIIDCLHEEISVAVAHGYAKATGKLTAAALHDIVGLQHATMAIYNAWCDRVPLLLLGGSGPADAALRRPWIDWIHTANVQATQVRDYTKWDDQPGSLPAAMESLVRARQLAMSAPRGPVYIALDSEIQESPVPTAWSGIEPGRYPVAQPLYPGRDVVRRIAQRLVGARSPVLAVESVDRDQETLERLVALAETLGAPVLEVQRDYNRTELCMPTQHPLNHTGMPLDEDPDLVLALEVRDTQVIPGCGDAPVIQVSTAGLAAKAWAADLQRVQPAEVLVAAQVSATLEVLLPEVRNCVDRARAQRRTAQLTAHAARHRAGWQRAASDDAGLTAAVLAERLQRATAGSDPVLANGSLHNWVHRLWSIDHVRSYLGSSGGAGLGYGLGASVGAALAHRSTDRLVIDIQSDGDALMTPGALWTAAHHRVPLLVVVENNRMWGNSFMHAQKMATARNRTGARPGVGTLIDDPAVDFAGLARAQGITATWTVTEGQELDPALAAATEHVLTTRTPALVDVVTATHG